MAKKILSLVLVIALTASIAIAGTVAYLTSTDEDVNVMTLGNVKIDQIEQQVGEDGVALEPFEQSKAIYPGTGVSKIVTVENEGKSDAYFRTLIAFEDLPNSETFGVNFPISEDYTWSWGAPEATIVIDGVTYQVYEARYNSILKAGDTSTASLTKVEFAASCTNEDMAALGDTYDILVLSQAVQTEGFADAATALDTAFGDVTADKAAEWFGGMYIPDYSLPAATVVDNTVTVPEGESQVLSGSYEETITVAGEGTLYLRNLNISVTSGHALALAEGTTVKLVAENEVV